jgi:succinate-semialdehyde dehydrogenase/glutarate-semialdehyde dehydrogenase
MDQGQAHLINGEWRNGSAAGQITVVDPATEEVIGSFAAASEKDTQNAIDAAAAAFRTWRATPAWTRADILHKCADVMLARTEEAARRITLEAGKPIAQSRREWQLSIDQFRWYAEEARRIHGRITESRAPGGRIEVHHEPVGVVAAFTAWNFPAVLIARKVAPALAAGCSIIVRPSRETPGTAAILMDCLRQAGVPAGVINLVVGPTATTLRRADEVSRYSEGVADGLIRRGPADAARRRRNLQARHHGAGRQCPRDRL